MQPKPSKARREVSDMNHNADTAPQPALELRCGGLHLTVQRIPVWLVSLAATAAGTAATWLAHR